MTLTIFSCGNYICVKREKVEDWVYLISHIQSKSAYALISVLVHVFNWDIEIFLKVTVTQII